MPGNSMTLLEKIRFCFFDIGAPRDRLITVSVIMTIFLLISSIVVSFGLAFGNQKVNEYRISRDPLAGAVLVGDEVHTQGQLSQESLSRFQKELTTEVPSLKGVFGFQAIVLSFVDGSTTFRCSGRTAKQDDPFVTELKKTDCLQLESEPEQGEVVSRKLLEALGFNEALPKYLAIDTGSGKQMISISNVVDELPYGWWFVLSEQTSLKIRAQESEAKLPVSETTTGLIPNDWLGQLKNINEMEGKDYEDLCNLASTRNLRCDGVKLIEETQQLLLEIRDSSGNPVPIGLTRELLNDWAKTLPEATTEQIAAFLDLTAPEIIDIRSNPVQPDYDMAGIYVGDYGDVVRVAKLADEQTIFRRNVDRESAKKLKRSDEQTKTTKEVAISFALILVAISSLSLLTTLGLRASRKMREVGMLRVLGFSILQIAQLWFIESIMIWIPAVSGIPIGYLIGSVIAKQKYAGMPCEAALGFSFTMTQFFILISASLLATIVFMLIPLTRWRKLDAADLL